MQQRFSVRSRSSPCALIQCNPLHIHSGPLSLSVPRVSPLLSSSLPFFSRGCSCLSLSLSGTFLLLLFLNLRACVCARLCVFISFLWRELGASSSTHRGAEQKEDAETHHRTARADYFFPPHPAYRIRARQRKTQRAQARASACLLSGAYEGGDDKL